MIAARVAAQLEKDPSLHIVREKGGLGELRVAVDGVDVIDTSRIWFPTPTSIVQKIQSYLRR